MTFAQIDDHFDIHPKYENFELEHYGLQACALTYCNRLLTDGKISSAAVRKMGKSGGVRATRLAKQLVEWGIWRAHHSEHLSGYEVIGYLDHNPSKAEVLRKRAEAKARKDAWKANNRPPEDKNGTPSGTPSGTRSGTQPEHPPLHSSPTLQEKKEDLPPVGGTRGAGTQTLLGVENAPPPPKEPKAAKKPAAPPVPKGKRLMPPDFVVSPAIEAMCRAEGLPNPHEVFPRFRDNVAANGRKYVDWEAAFRNWMRSPITERDHRPWSESDPASHDEPKEPVKEMVFVPPPDPELFKKIMSEFAAKTSNPFTTNLPPLPPEAAEIIEALKNGKQ